MNTAHSAKGTHPSSHLVVPRQNYGKTIAAITVGNGLEFFDFAIYTYFATVIGEVFFPSGSKLTQLLFSLATFGVGFVARPLGGVVIGMYADRVGRKSAMVLSLWLTALGSAVFVVAPTFATIGIFAPVLLIVGRLIQGFAIGGEFGASTSMLVEYAGTHNRGVFASWQLVSQAASTLLGSLTGLALTTMLTHEQLILWGWRLAFALGIAVIPIGAYIRNQLHEEPLKPTAARRMRSPAMELFRDHSRSLLVAVLLIAGAASANYIALHYLTNFAVGVLKMTLAQGLWASILAGSLQLVIAVPAGLVSDRYGRKPVLATAWIVLLASVFPAFLWLSTAPNLTHLLGLAAVLTIPTAFVTVTTVTMISEIFPRAIRATGLSIAYSLGVSIFGGFAQFIATLLVQLTGSKLAPAGYMIALGLVAFAALTQCDEMAGRTLD
ncbi:MULTISPECIES: MFS transporter [Paraburkholderia]|uniref:MFS transporter n=1 Tax=Paraburkholderia dipogonis TaxID=1211383 RepID=A0A4Y8MGW2_9BURK|nr:MULTISPECIES: MFS transporter [Paraburkholderia]RKR31331.1 sugar transport protein [Paraburkholderia sp. BL17N1]TFE36700.1 MFS transporter [Paraburkholderia dipogonis]